MINIKVSPAKQQRFNAGNNPQYVTVTLFCGRCPFPHHHIISAIQWNLAASAAGAVGLSWVQYDGLAMTASRVLLTAAVSTSVQHAISLDETQTDVLY